MAQNNQQVRKITTECLIIFGSLLHLTFGPPQPCPKLGRSPLAVDPNIGDKHPQKVFMDGDKYLNILYRKTLYAMKIPCSYI
jgi:hypothetical protein